MSGSTPSSAQVPNPNESRTELKQGQKAPFDGVLVSKEALAYLLSQMNMIVRQGKLALEACEQQCNDKLEIVAQRCEIRIESAQMVSKACETAREQDKRIYETALKKSESTPWWKSPMLSAVLGAAAAGTICGVAR